MFKWNKLGLIFDPTNRFDWMHTHCQLPVITQINESIHRVYFASRDKNQISEIGWVDIDIKNPKEIINFSKTPILSRGDYGCFDEHGVFPSSIIDIGEKKYLYYIGWVRGFESPMFYASIGLAVSEDNGVTFKKYSKSPILSRSEFDPCLVTSPNVIKVGNTFKMTYVSGIKWFRDENNQLKSKYHIKIANSNDGVKWLRDGKIAVDFKNKNETNIARPSVIYYQNTYHMWFSYVEGESLYKIGYASSIDFEKWIRDDKKSGLTLSKSGFDSYMTCYPNVFNYNNSHYMLYNGNEFGKYGFGLAIQE